MNAPARRLFFALWPNDAERDQLLDTIRVPLVRLGGRPVPRHNLHMTLAFVGAVASERFDDLGEIAAAVAHAARAPLGVTLDHLQHWVRSKLVCAVPSQDPAEVRDLANPLVMRLRAGGFPMEARAFRPHVTIARDVVAPAATQDLAPVRWNFESFALVESAPRSRYRVLETWTLGHSSSAVQ